MSGRSLTCILPPLNDTRYEKDWRSGTITTNFSIRAALKSCVVRVSRRRYFRSGKSNRRTGTGR